MSKRCKEMRVMGWGVGGSIVVWALYQLTQKIDVRTKRMRGLGRKEHVNKMLSGDEEGRGVFCASTR